MATRLIGTDTINPRLPALVIAATQGTTADDLAPGDVLADAQSYTDTAIAAIPPFGDFATDAETFAGTVDDKAVTPAGLVNAVPFFDVRNYGAVGDGVTSDSAAIQAAINAATAESGTVYFPPSTTVYLVTTPLQLKGNVQFLGDYNILGGDATRLYTATGNLFTATTTIHAVSFTGLELHSGPGGGHIFDMNGQSLAGWQFDRCAFYQDNNAKSVLRTGGGDAVELHVDHCWSIHTAAATVPTWHMVSNFNAINVCSWRNSRFQNSGNYQIHIETTSTAYCQDLVFDNLNFQQCLGGEIKLLSVRDARLSNVAAYDAPSPYTRSRIYIGKAATGSGSVENLLSQVVRRGGSLTGGVYDIETSADSGQTTLIRCNGSIQLNSTGGNVIIGGATSAPASSYLGLHESTVRFDGFAQAWNHRVAGTAGFGYLEFAAEQSSMSAPAANGARLYTRDTAGNTELVALFATGNVERIVTQGGTGNVAGMAPSMFGRTGEYWAIPGTRALGPIVAQAMYCTAIYVPYTKTVDRIGIEVTTAVGGSTISLGIYEDDGTGCPGVLLVDAGTVSGAAIAAVEATISTVLQAGRLYHLAAMAQGGAPTCRILSTTWTGINNTLLNATSGLSPRPGRSRSSIVGTALPNPAAATAMVGGPPIIAVRFV